MNIYLKRLLFIVFLSCLWNMVIPGIVAYVDGVYFSSQVAAKIPSHSKNALKIYQEYKRRQGLYNSQIDEIDQRLISLQKQNNYNDITSLVGLRNTYLNELKNLKCPILIGAYNDNKSVYYTLSSYIILGVLIFILLRAYPIRSSFYLKLLVVSLTIYFLWMFSNWIRNFLFYDEGRSLFIYVNFDISPASFWLQESRIFGICILISILWLKLNDLISQQIIKINDAPVNYSVLIRQSKELNEIFTFWQIASVFVVLTFLPWTLLYWVNIGKYEDYRYLIPAVVIHLYWAITWILLTVPVLKSYNHWINSRANFLIGLNLDNENMSYSEKYLSFLKEINPLSTFEIIGAGIGSIISFLLPFLNLIFR